MSGTVGISVGAPRRALLPACLLLEVAEKPAHGYELADRLKAWGFELSGPGPVYRALRAMEGDKLLRSTYSTAEPRSGPVQRIYNLTAKGRKALADHAQELATTAHMIDEYWNRFSRIGS